MVKGCWQTTELVLIDMPVGATGPPAAGGGGGGGGYNDLGGAGGTVNTAGSDGVGYGSGGGGAGERTSGGPYNGGNGKQGIIIVEEVLE